MARAHASCSVPASGGAGEHGGDDVDMLSTALGVLINLAESSSALREEIAAAPAAHCGATLLPALCRLVSSGKRRAASSETSLCSRVSSAYAAAAHWRLSARKLPSAWRPVLGGLLFAVVG